MIDLAGVLSVFKLIKGVIDKVVYPATEFTWERTGRGLVVTRAQLPVRGVWDIGLRFALTDKDLAAVPSQDTREQGMWLLKHKNGTLFETRGDRFEVFNNLNKVVEIERLEVEIKSRRTQTYVTEIRSPNAGYVEEDVLGADLRAGADHVVREAKMEAGYIDWDGVDFDVRSRRVFLQPKEVYSFQLYTTTGPDTVEWRICLQYSVRGLRGNKSQLKKVCCPRVNETPLVTANQSESGAEEYWLTGAGGLIEAPYFQRATLREGDLLPEDFPW